jgi:hypothetical protein
MKDILRKEMKKIGLDKDLRSLLRLILEDKKPVDVGRQAAASGALNGCIEGVLVGLTCHEYVREGVMTGKEASKKVLVGASSGFVTSASGTAITYSVAKYLGNTGPISIAAGMAASAGTRYAWARLLKRAGVEDLDAWLEATQSIKPPHVVNDEEDEDEEDEDE